MPDEPSAFDPADLFGDDAEAGREFTRSVEDFFRSEDGRDPEARRRDLLEKYKAAKAAAQARRSPPALSAHAAPRPLPPLPPLPAARSLPPLSPASGLSGTPLPPLPPLSPSPSLSARPGQGSDA